MSKHTEDLSTSSAATESLQKCGIVMPISASDTCTEQHWSEVKTIITDAVESVGFATSLVSDADDVGIIQKRIIQNLFDNPIIVCDVSTKNPNVMFELGMRLAFDKPTIIVKDDKTTYSFDTSPIEHLEYPRDLRFTKIVEFKRNLGEKVKATVARAESDAEYTTFLKHFGKFAVARLETTEVSKEDFIIEELRELRKLVLRRDMMSDRDRDKQRFFINHSDQVIENESNRKAMLRKRIKSYTYTLFEKGMIDKDKMNVQEAVIRITNDLIKQSEIREFFDSPSEVEEIVHMTLSNFYEKNQL